MPCRDYYDDNPAAYYDEKVVEKDAAIKILEGEVAFAESALCGALTALERTVSGAGNENPRLELDVCPLELIDFDEVGIEKEELHAWWENHKRVDKERKEKELTELLARKLKEQREKDELKLRKAALDKLTPVERTILGLD